MRLWSLSILFSITLLNSSLIWAAPEQTEENRTLHFPTTHSVGRVYSSYWHVDPAENSDLVKQVRPLNVMVWNLVGEAQGDVSVPVDAIIKLQVNVGTARNLAWISHLKPDDLFEFELSPLLPQHQLRVGDNDVRHLRHLTGLTCLQLYHVDVSDRGLNFLKEMRRLKSLGYYSPKLGNRGLKVIGQLEQLEELNLGKGTWNDIGLTHLSGLKSVRRLFFSTLDVKGPGLSFLKQLPALESLAIDISDQQLSYFNHSTSLREIQLDRSIISDRGLSLLTGFPNLESVNLSGNQLVTDQGLEQLQQLKKLKRLNLMNANVSRKENRITLKGVQHLTEINTLEKLYLPSQGIGEEVLELITALPHLKQFWGGVDQKTPLSDDAMKNLPKLTQLEELHLNTKGITETGLGYIGSLSNLKVLHLPTIINESNNSLKLISSLHRLEKLSGPKETVMTSAALNSLNELSELRLLQVNEFQPPAVDDPPLDLSNLSKLDFLMLPSVRDKDLVWLKNCKKLTRLQIVPQTSISDIGMAHLADLPSLQILTVGGPRLSDASLQYLQGKPALSIINLIGDFTDEGIQSLSQLRNLWSIEIQTPHSINTKVQKHLAQSLPHLYSLQIKQSVPDPQSLNSPIEHKVRNVTYRKPLSAEATSPETTTHRVLHFPKTHSVGEVFIANEKVPDPFPDQPLDVRSDSEWDWNRLGEARGDIRVPVESHVKFKLNAGTARNMAWISRLASDDLHEFEVHPFIPGYQFRVGDDDVRHLQHLTGLSRLKLSFVDVSDRGFRFLQALPQLESLSVYSPKLGNDGLAIIGKLTKLEFLHLGEGLWNDSGLTHLKDLAKLKQISLRVHNVSGPGLQTISSLPELDIFACSSSPFQDRHMVHLKESSSIKQLLLDSSQLTDTGLKSISQMPQLENLNLSYSTTFTDAGLKHIGSLRRLRRLNLSQTNSQRQSHFLTSEGISQLNKIDSLEHLNLPTTGMSEEVFQVASQFLKLRSLTIGRGYQRDLRPISSAMLEPLRSLDQLEIFSFTIKGWRGTGWMSWRK
ncbi:Leucine Rich repeats (2 copies) [Polystyrenella longa]|uniref:Leucine Rich repeats (2 copies) n=1 Tax=Polystyrenella longa TaxID=2528007 RepID=A0A518CUJ7_9PLAN|nr:hypothetical protein [Polystyrenella longa]QDU82902.1 Leucine Rich repeats (2 copies) [Polystyrenella longa]